jgi:hypothetical protein
MKMTVVGRVVAGMHNERWQVVADGYVDSRVDFLSRKWRDVVVVPC